MKFLTIILAFLIFSCKSNSGEWKDSKAICKCLQNNERKISNAIENDFKDSILIDCYLRNLVINEYYLKQEMDKKIFEDLEKDSCEIYYTFYKERYDENKF